MIQQLISWSKTGQPGIQVNVWINGRILQDVAVYSLPVIVTVSQLLESIHHVVSFLIKINCFKKVSLSIT